MVFASLHPVMMRTARHNAPQPLLLAVVGLAVGVMLAWTAPGGPDLLGAAIWYLGLALGVPGALAWAPAYAAARRTAARIASWLGRVWVAVIVLLGCRPVPPRPVVRPDDAPAPHRDVLPAGPSLRAPPVLVA
jgi:hypothetical protein